MRPLSALLPLGVCLFLVAPSLADDGSSQLGAGGIVFVKSADIRMAREDLYLSPDKARIRFAFQNVTARDQDVVIAFPLPDLDLQTYKSEDVGVLQQDPVNYVGFTATVDGRKVPIAVEQKAMLKGRDLSAIVKSVGLPVNLHGRYELLDKLPRAKKAILEKAGLAVRANPDADDQEDPLWTVQTRYYWTQHFPAGKTVVIEHAYTPVTGGSQYYDSTDSPARPEDWAKPFCFDKGLSARLRAMLADPRLRATDPDSHYEAGGPLYAQLTDYVLLTANTWKGPIGLFHLTLDKLDPHSVLSLCWKGDLKKTGPTTFEFSADNFTPTQDIKMLVLR